MKLLTANQQDHTIMHNWRAIWLKVCSHQPHVVAEQKDSGYIVDYVQLIENDIMKCYFCDKLSKNILHKYVMNQMPTEYVWVCFTVMMMAT